MNQFFWYPLVRLGLAYPRELSFLVRVWRDYSLLCDADIRNALAAPVLVDKKRPRGMTFYRLLTRRRLIRLVRKIHPKRPRCLQESAVWLAHLRSNHIASEIVLGWRADAAHAWVRRAGATSASGRGQRGYLVFERLS